MTEHRPTIPDPPTFFSSAGTAAGLPPDLAYGDDFVAILCEMNVALAVSTYQSDLIFTLQAGSTGLRAQAYPVKRPMGIATDGDRLFVGTQNSICEFRERGLWLMDVDQEEGYDALYVPYVTHRTGEVMVHELALRGADVVFVNTSYSCLSALGVDGHVSVEWSPPFISDHLPEDRCHLNGLAIASGAIRYATCFGITDAPSGWRLSNGSQGTLLDVPSGEPIVEGLHMPHSPRYHDGSAWLLESTSGLLVQLAEDATPIEVATVPGFARGLAFAGPYAFVGTSLPRDTNRDLHLSSVLEESCGISVVDIDSGVTAASLRFGGMVTEIFDIQVIPHRSPEPIGQSA